MSSGVNQRIVLGQNNWKVVAPPFHVNATRTSNGHFFLATKPLTPRIHHSLLFAFCCTGNLKFQQTFFGLFWTQHITRVTQP